MSIYNRAFYTSTHTIFFHSTPLVAANTTWLVGITDTYMKTSINKLFNQNYFSYISFKIKIGKKVKNSEFYITSLKQLIK